MRYFYQRELDQHSFWSTKLHTQELLFVYWFSLILRSSIPHSTWNRLLPQAHATSTSLIFVALSHSITKPCQHYQLWRNEASITRFTNKLKEFEDKTDKWPLTLLKVWHTSRVFWHLHVWWKYTLARMMSFTLSRWRPPQEPIPDLCPRLLVSCHVNIETLSLN